MGQQLARLVSAVTPLGDALDGTPIKRKRATKKVGPNSVVTSNVVCYCGSRFGDLIDFSTHVRTGCPELVRVGNLRKSDGTRLIAECGTIGGYDRHWRKGEEICEPCRVAKTEDGRRYRSAPAVRERRREAARERRSALGPQEREEQRERLRERDGARYADPVTGQQIRERSRDYQRDRRKDPAFRERQREYLRNYRARKKPEKETTPA